MSLEETLEKIKELKKEENDLYLNKSSLSSAYAAAGYREQDALDQLYEMLDKKISEIRKEIENLKLNI